MKLKSATWIAFALAACLSVNAQAQEDDSSPIPEKSNLPAGCMDLDNNPTWNEVFNELTANYKAKDYQAALRNAQTLNTICELSPVLNFSIGRIYREMGDDTKGLYYMQRATLFTKEFAVRGELLERMWYERYEIEHVDARDDVIAARKKQIEERNKIAAGKKKDSDGKELAPADGVD